MPKSYITKQEQMNNQLVSMIYGTMKVKRMTQSQMAEKLAITQQSFGKKLKKAQFTYSDLTTIFETLDIPDEDIVKVMKIKGR